MFWKKKASSHRSKAHQSSGRDWWSRARRRQFQSLRAEPLEERALLAIVTWDGGAGTSNWSDSANWDTDTLPAGSDDVTINVAASNPTITVANSVTINSLITTEAITFTGGTFSANTLQINGAVATLSGAVLKGLTVSGTGTLQVSSADGTFDGLTLGVNTTLRDGAQVTVLNDLNLANNRTLRLERTSTASNANSDATLDVGLNFSGGEQTLGGTGFVVLFHSLSPGAAPLDRNVRVGPTGTGASLTIAPGVVVRNGPFSGQSVLGDSTLPLILQGTVNATSPGQTLRVRGSTVTNTGTLHATAGVLDVNNLTGNVNSTAIVNGDLDLDGNYTLNQPVNVPAGTGALTLRGQWINASTITQSGGTVNLDDTFTLADLGIVDTPSRFNRSGGTVNVIGTLDNTGTTLPLTGTAGSWQLAMPAGQTGGTILGGVVTTSGGAKLIVSTGGTLDGVVLNGDLDVNNTLTILNDLTLNGTATLNGASARMALPGAQTITGSGTVLFNGGGTIDQTQIGASLTVEAGITLQGGGGSIGPVDVFVHSTTIVNYGTIIADVNAKSISVEGNFTNHGVMEVENGGVLFFTFGNIIQNGTATVNGGTLTFNNSGGGSWTNTGTINSVNGTINLGGSFTVADMGILDSPSRFTRSGGTINLFGTLDNTGTTLPLDALPGDWTLSGTILGGTVTSSGGSKLITRTSAHLNGVTLNCNLELSDTNGFTTVVTISNGLVLNGTVDFLTLFGRLDFSGTQALSGSGRVALRGRLTAARLTTAGTTLTIGAGITVQGRAGGVLGEGDGSLSRANVSVINYGTILAEFFSSSDPNRDAFRVQGAAFTNYGVLETKNGGELDLRSLVTVQNGMAIANGGRLSFNNDWTNPGTIHSNNGVVDLGGIFTVADLGIYASPSRFTRSGGTVNLTGTLDNAGHTLRLDAATGSWHLRSGTIRGGIVTTTGGSKLIADAPNASLGVTASTLDGMILNGDLDLAVTSAVVTVVNGLTLNGTASLSGQSARLDFSGSQTLSGAGTVALSSGTAMARLSIAGTTLTIGAGITVRGSGVLGQGDGSFSVANVSLVNHGTISADVSGTLKVQGALFTNHGLLESKSSGFLRLSSTELINNGKILATGGSVVLLPNTLIPTGGTIEANGGTIIVSVADTSTFLVNGSFDETGTILRTDLVGGAWRAGPNSTLRINFGNGTPVIRILNLAADVELYGAGSNLQGGSGGDALAALATIGPTGRFTIRNGRNYTAAATLTNQGQLRVEAGSELTVPSGESLIQAGGVTTINGSLLADAVTATGGTLKGDGTITADVTNIGGTVAPGNSPGILDIFGDYTQGPGGMLLIELAGRDPDAPQFDRLRVTGTATLDGRIRAELLDDFEPTPGDAFRVLSAASREGRFSIHDFPYPGGMGRQINPLYDTTGLTLQAQIVPPLIFVDATTSGVDNGQHMPEQVVFDQFGNSYVTGSFSGNVDFDREHVVAGDTIASTGTDGFVAKYDSAGQLLWVQSIDGAGAAFGAGIAIDHGNPLVSADDRVFITGAFSSSASYGGQNVTGVTQDGYLLQVDSLGAPQLFSALPGGSTAIGRRLAVAPSGNVVIAGEFTGTMVTLATTLVSAGAADAFVMEYAIGSGVVRAARIGGPLDDRGTDVALTSTGDVWFAGEFAETTTGLAALTSSGSSDAFLLRLNPFATTFATSVARSFGGAGDETAAAVAVDPSNNVVLGGSFEFSVDFDHAPQKAFTLHSGGDHDVYLVKLAGDGAFEWARAVGGYREDLLADVTIDAAGHIYATGEFRDRVDFDPLDDIHLLATSGENTPEAFLTKLDAAGSFLWGVQLGERAGAISRGAGLDVSSTGRIVAVGEFQGTVDFDPTPAVSLRTFSPSVVDASAGYLALVDQKAIPQLAIVGLPAGAVLEGTTLALAASIVDPDSIRFDYTWTVTRGGVPYASGEDGTLNLLLVDQGIYTITLVTVDESGNRDAVTTTVIANNAAPTITSLTTSSATISENGLVTVSGTFSDPGVHDRHTLVIDWNDGSLPQRVSLPAGVTTFSATHRYLDDDPTATTSDTVGIKVRVQDNTLDVLATQASGALVRYDGTTLYGLGQLIAAGSTAAPSAATVGPDGDIYVSSGDVGANPVLRFDGITGALVGTFIAPGSGGATQATDLMVGRDGHLYYLDGAGNRVLRFHGRTGEFIDVFVAAGSGGLSDPRGAEFGPDGDLYVASFGSDRILRYHGRTGALVGEVVEINAPLDLAFGRNEELFVLTAQPTPAVLRFDAATGEPLGTLANLSLSGTTGRLMLGANNKLFVSDPGGPLLEFDAATGALVGQANSNDGALAGLPQQAQAVANVTINNTPPQVQVAAAANATAGEYTLSAQVFDQGTRDTFSYLWTVTGATIVGSASDSNVRIASATGTFTVGLTVTDDDNSATTVGVQVRVGTAGADAITLSNPAASIHKIIVYGLGGNDTISAASVTTVPVELIGGDGDDVLTGGAMNDVLLGNNPGDYALPSGGDRGNDTLTGNAGNDTLDGGLGNDTMSGGLGNDHYIEVPGSDDVLIEGGAGSGIDTIDYGPAYFGIHFDLAATALPQVVNPAAPTADQHTVEIRGDFENLIGSRFSDVLAGNGFNNLLQGQRGDDAIHGGAGDDVIYGGDETELLILEEQDGDDLLEGGEGEDLLDGGTGDDELIGGEGDDELLGGEGDDTLAGGELEELLPDEGSDLLDGGAGEDLLDGGAGDDVLIGGEDDDVLIGDAGDDVIFGGDETELLILEEVDGDDLLDGGEGEDVLDGGAGDDALVGGEGEDLLDGGAGDDELIGGEGDDELRGGEGDDTLAGGELEELLPDEGSDLLDGGAGEDLLDGGAGDDVLIGGEDDDVLIGDAGDDVIYGGDETELLILEEVDGDDLLDGGEGEDVLDGGAGDDVLSGGEGDDTLSGGEGDDTLAGGELEELLPDDGSDLLDGGAGDDVLEGGTGEDVLLGGADDDSLTGGEGDDLLLGGLDEDILTGDAGDDVIYGGAGDDTLAGGSGADIFEGGSGNDRIVESHAGDVTLTPTQLAAESLPVEFHFDIELATLVGGAGNNLFDTSSFVGSVLLIGLGGDDTLIGGAFADLLLGGDGNDTLFAHDGDDTLDGGAGDDQMHGGAGNDRYLQTPGSHDVLNDPLGIDSIDMGAAMQAVTLDLGIDTPQAIDGSGNVLTLNGTFENFRGTSFNDSIVGNSQRNVLDGAGGLDHLDGGLAADTIQGNFTQLVYLDFVSATGPGERVYSIEERNDIQSRLEQVFPAPFSISFTQTRPSIGRFTTIVVNAGSREDNEPLVGGIAQELDWRNYNPGAVAAVNVNEFLGRRGQPAASGANFIALTTTVIAHELGHLFGLQHYDAFGPLGAGIFEQTIARSVALNELVPGTPLGSLGTSTVVYPLRRAPVLLAAATQAGNLSPNPFQLPGGTIFEGETAVASFTVDASGLLHPVALGSGLPAIGGGRLDPISGRLELDWLQPPAQSFITITYYYDVFRPGYRGPDDAFETPAHVMASPASVGSGIADSLREAYLGERSLIKLAFAEAGTARQESELPILDIPAVLGAVGRNLGDLPPLAVPQLLPETAFNFGKQLQVEAINVVGSIQQVAGVSENDVYVFSGTAGERVTVEILSAVLRHRLSDDIDATLALYNSAGVLLDYYNQAAFNDDGFSGQDPLLLDVALPTDGTYFIVVDTFTSVAVPDTDTGEYELFIYKYTVDTLPRQNARGDILIGGADGDVLIGSAGDDRFIGDLLEDRFLGFSAFDFLGPEVDPNFPPTAVDDFALTDENSPVAINVLANDTDPDSEGPATFALVSIDSVIVSGLSLAGLTTATLSEGAEGVIEFNPGSDFDELAVTQQAAVTVRYTMSDDDGLISTATLVISVSGANDRPTARTDVASATENGWAVSIDVLANDFDVDLGDSDLLRVDLLVPPWAASGAVVSATGLPSAGIGYDPSSTSVFESLAAGETATDLITYRVDDSRGGLSDFVLVTVIVAGSNDAPTALSVTATAMEDGGAVAAAFAADDIDSDDTPATLSYTILTPPVAGTVTNNNDGTFTFAPGGAFQDLAVGQTREVAFTYSAADRHGAISNEATVVITVMGTNDAPTALSATANATEDGGTVLAAFAADDIDSDDTPATLSYSILTLPAEGTVTNNNDGTFTFAPGGAFQDLAVGQTREVAFTYSAADRHGAISNEATVVITVMGTNDAPTALSVTATAMEDGGAVAAAFAADDIDSDDTPATLSYTILTPPVAGTVTNNSDGTFSFAPGGAFQDLAVGQTREVAFTYSAADRHGAISNEATVVITVMGTNDAPQITTLSSNNPDVDHSSANGQVLLNGEWLDPDVTDTHNVTVDWGDGSVAALLSVNQLSDTFAGTHTYAAGGIYTITVRVDDGRGGIATAATTAVVQGVGMVGGTLYVIGTEGKDDVNIHQIPRRETIVVDARLSSGPRGHHGSGGHGHHHRDYDRIRQTFDASQIETIVVYLGGGDDHFHTDEHDDRDDDDRRRDCYWRGDEISLAMEVFGGEGDDHLRTGAGHDLIDGGPGDDHLEGDRGHDILLGGDGDDHLDGGAGRDLLLGGLGADHLQGGADDDLLIAGFTLHDANLAALDIVMALWSSSRSYAQRVASLSGETSPNSSPGVLLNASTVFDDEERDILSGDSGTDWFLLDLDGRGRRSDKTTDDRWFEVRDDIDLPL